MMHKLDGQKAHRIEETWTKVKDKLGEIFRTLLPGADATLQPLTGHSILDGRILMMQRTFISAMLIFSS